MTLTDSETDEARFLHYFIENIKLINYNKFYNDDDKSNDQIQVLNMVDHCGNDKKDVVHR